MSKNKSSGVGSLNATGQHCHYLCIPCNHACQSTFWESSGTQPNEHYSILILSDLQALDAFGAELQLCSAGNRIKQFAYFFGPECAFVRSNIDPERYLLAVGLLVNIDRS